MQHDQESSEEKEGKQKLIRYLTVAQHHQTQRRRKRHLPAQKAKWRFIVIALFIFIFLTGLYGAFSEIGALPTL